LATENANVAHYGTITHANVAIQGGISFRHGDAAVRAAYGNVVHGCYVCHVHRYPNPHVRVVLGNEEKKAYGTAGKARKNAYAHALTPSV
jgi:hypothetical protein